MESTTCFSPWNEVEFAQFKSMLALDECLVGQFDFELANNGVAVINLESAGAIRFRSQRCANSTFGIRRTKRCRTLPSR
jgi:hypothetical protein